MTQPPATPIDAATVVVARDTPDGIEVLMLRKNSRIHFGGMWVFPGGRVDDGDRQPGDDRMAPFRRAAVREAHEEAGVDLSGCELTHLSHWLPPPVRPKRFSTQFFITRAPDGLDEITIDGGEITDHGWTTPAHALHRRHAGEIDLVTPTFVTLDQLRRHATLDAVLESIREPVCFHTHITDTPRGKVAFYPGDVAYETLDPDQPGPRRRANMFDTGWWWEEHDGNGNGPCPEPIL